MDIEGLRTFLTVAQTRSFTATAMQLYIAQSTVTNRIAELESEMSVKLFHRTKRNVELTTSGQQFLSYAEKIVELADTSVAGISAADKYENSLFIGTADSIYEADLASVLTEYRRNNPKDALRVTISVSTKLIEQLSSGIIDVVFSYLPATDSKYVCNVYRKDEMVLVTDAANEDYKDGITGEELLKVDYIMCNFALQDVGQFIRGIFPKHHMFSLEIDDCSKVIPYLYGQKNYTFLPRQIALKYLEAGTLREIKLLDIKTPLIQSYMIGKKSKIDLWSKVFAE